MRIPRWFAAVGLLCMSALALAADGPPPPEVQRILEKMRKGQPPTSEEQKVLSDWGMNPARRADTHAQPGAGFAEGSAIPSDVQAILDRLKQGQRPSSAEMARLQQWRDDMNAHKADILQGDAQLRSNLQGARPPGAAPSEGGDPYRGLLQGEIVLAPNQQLNQDASKDFSHLHFGGSATFPVLYTLRPPTQPNGPWGLTWQMRPDRQAGGNFTTHGNGRRSDGSTTVMDQRFHGGGGLAQGVMMAGELFVDPGRPRPYVSITQALVGDIQLDSTTTDSEGHSESQSGSSRGAAGLVGIELDQTRLDIPWKRSGIDPALAARFGLKGVIPAEDQAAANAATFPLDARQLWAGIQGGQPFEISAPYHYSVRRTVEQGGVVTTESTTLITFRFRNPPKGEMELGVLDAENAVPYAQWFPKPYVADANLAKILGVAPHDESLALTVHVRVKTAEGQPVKKVFMDLRLKDLSKNKGYAANYPLKAEQVVGLRFLPDQPGLDDVSNGDTSAPHLRTHERVSELTVKVVANEPGAFGNLEVVSEDLDGTAALYKPTGENYLRVPKDDNGNKVADGWEQAQGVRPNLPATWDEDESPQGQRRNGDGYTLYEEYRGFVVLKDQGSSELTHLRTDWNSKDIFIWDKDGIIKTYYEPHNAEAARLVLHYVDGGLMKQAQNADPDHRWMNFNTDPQLRYARQYGVIALIDNALTDKKGQPIDGGASPWGGVNNNATYFQAMRSFYEIRVNFKNSASKFTGLGSPEFGFTPKEVDAVILGERYDLVIHEFGHQIGIRHHFPKGVTFDYAAPKYTPEGKLDWPETIPSQAEGVTDCVMRYYSQADVNETRRTHVLKYSTRYCHKGETAHYANGVTGPSDDCYGQIDVKSDP